MHRTAEYGIAAHWLFKEGKGPDELDRHLAWFRQLLELQQDAHTPEEFLEFLKIDLYQDEIFVFTPRGDVKRLPKGATPIDFAFAVHTEVGQHCHGRPRQRPHRAAASARSRTATRSRSSPARRPGRRATGSPTSTPARARHKIRQWIKQEEHDRSVALGTGDPGARGAPPAPRRRPTRSGWPRPPPPCRWAPAEQLEAALGRGDVAAGPGDARPLSRPSGRRPPAAQADGVRAGHPAPAAGARHQDPGRRRPDGALRPVLPAGAGRPGRGLRHPGTGHLDPPRRLPQPARRCRPRRSGGSRSTGRSPRARRSSCGWRWRARTAAASTPISARR